MALLSLSALIINVVLRKNVKFRRVYLHICLYIVSIILLFMLSFYLYSNISMLNMEKIMYNASYSDNIYINANVVYGITSLILPFAVANLIFAFLAFLFVKSLVSITVEDSEMSVVESQQATEVSSTKQKLMQEIQDLKDSLEIEDLKSEYKNLYKKYSQKTKED